MVAARALSPRMRRPATLLVVAILATALSSALPAAASPAAAGGTPMPAGVPRPDGGKPMPLVAPNGPSGTACQILIGKAAGPKHLSPVLSSECAKPGERLTAAATNTLLMVWYTGYNYSGRSTKIYGQEGPCDSGGYGFAWVSSAWNDAIRAWKVFNSCNYSAAWEDINWGGFCKKYYGQVPNASAMDAEISSMWISKGSWAWTLCG